MVNVMSTQKDNNTSKAIKTTFWSQLSADHAIPKYCATPEATVPGKGMLPATGIL